MPFPADENYFYAFVRVITPRSVFRLQYTGGIPTDDTRNATRVATNVPGSYDIPPISGGRRVYSINPPVAPFGTLPYTGGILRRVANTVTANGVPTIEDFNVGTALSSGEFHITERDFYRYYLMHYLSFLDAGKLSKGQISTIDWSNVTFLFNLVGSGFVTNATLPTLPDVR